MRRISSESPSSTFPRNRIAKPIPKSKRRDKLKHAQYEIEHRYSIRDKDKLDHGPNDKKRASHNAPINPCAHIVAIFEDDRDDVRDAVYEQKCQSWPEMACEEHVMERKGIVYGKGHPIVPGKGQGKQRGEHHPQPAHGCANPIEPIHE